MDRKCTTISNFNRSPIWYVAPYSSLLIRVPQKRRVARWRIIHVCFFSAVHGYAFTGRGGDLTSLRRKGASIHLTLIGGSTWQKHAGYYEGCGLYEWTQEREHMRVRERNVELINYPDAHIAFHTRPMLLGTLREQNALSRRHSNAAFATTTYRRSPNAYCAQRLCRA